MLTGNIYSNIKKAIRALTTSDRAHADVFNEVFQDLIDNDVTVEAVAKQYTDQQVQLITESGIPKLQTYRYTLTATTGQTEMQIPLSTFSATTDSEIVILNSVVIDRDSDYTVSETGLVTFTEALNESDNVSFLVLKNVPIGEDGSVHGKVIATGTIEADRLSTNAIATTTEAQAGTDNTRVMTPLRVVESITSKAILKNNFLNNMDNETTGKSYSLEKSLQITFTGDTNGRWIIHFPRQAFFGSIEFEFTSLFNNFNASGGLKGVFYYGVDTNAEYEKSTHIYSASQQFLTAYYLNEIYSDNDNTYIILEKRSATANNSISVNLKFNSPENIFLNNINNTLNHYYDTMGSIRAERNVSYQEEINNLKSQYSSRFAEIASAITGKGVPTDANANASTIINNINAIQVGGKFASGTVSNTSNQLTFTQGNDSTANSFYVTVAGLNFKPSRIVVISKNAEYGSVSLYSVDGISNVAGANFSAGNMFNAGNNTTTNTNVYKESGNAYVNSNGFQIPVKTVSTSFQWYAYE